MARRCHRCKRELPLGDFVKSPNVRGGGGYSPECKQCHSARSREAYGRRPERRIWLNMLARCYDPKNDSFANYGGRGIRVCERWRASFEDFLRDLGPRLPGMTLDRKDPDGNYEPGNCRWATVETQNRNRGGFNVVVEAFGERRLLIEWSEQRGIPYQTLYARLNRHGWSAERALSTPVRGAR